MSGDSFKTFVQDQLHDLSGMRFLKMFGGYGIYQGNLFFAIISGGKLYFKTNETTRKMYLEHGTTPFMYGTRGSVKKLKNYYEVLVDVLEDDEQLVIWARRAAEVAAKG
jgi:DNA transformation protein